MATRRERVVLDVESNAVQKFAEAAAGAKVLGRELDGLSGRAVQTTRTVGPLGNEVEVLDRKARRGGEGINQLTGRLALARDISLTLGPALLPISALAVPAFMGLASQLSLTVAAAGTSVLAFQGVGDALEALNAARLEPTTENLEKSRQAMTDLSPAAQTLVRHLSDLAREGKNLRDIAAEGMFPGMLKGLDALETRLPDLQAVIAEISDATGDILGNAGESLASERWDFLFDYVMSNGREQLNGVADAVGNVVHGFGELLVAFTPLERDFTGWLRGATEDFDQWSARLSADAGFQQFVAYVRENGPEVAEASAAIADALTQIVQAAAPLGGPGLQALEAFGDVVATIADSDIGTPLLTGLAALSVYNRGLKVSGALMESTWGSRARSSLSGMVAGLTQVTSAQERASMSTAALAAAEQKRSAAVRGGLATIGKGAAVAGALAVATSGVADGMGLANTATLGLAGSVAGPWGAAIGAGVGLLLDWRDRSAGAKEMTAEFTGTLDQQTGALTTNTRALAVKKLADSGALDAAKDLGLSMALVTDAALGNETAVAKLSAALGNYDGTVTAATTGRGASTRKYYTEQATAANKVRDAVGSVASSVADSQATFDQQAAAMGGTTRQTNELRDAYDRTADAAAGLTGELEQLDGLLSKRGAYRAYQASLDDLKASLKDSPNAWSEFTRAGRENLGNLDQIVSNAIRNLDEITSPRKKAAFLDDVVSQLKSIGDTSPAAASAVRKVLPAIREVQAANKIVVVTADNADALKKAAVTKLAMRELNTMRPRPRVEVDPGNSLTVLGLIRNSIAALHDKSVTITTRRVSVGAGLGAAVGGGFAAGGVIDTVAGPPCEVPAALADAVDLEPVAA